MRRLLLALLVSMPALAQTIDLAVEVIPGTSPVARNSPASFVLRARQLGTAANSEGVIVSFNTSGDYANPSDAAVALSASGSGWTCGTASTGGTCTRTGITPGTYPDITVNITSPKAGTYVTMLATISHDFAYDENDQNNRATGSIALLAPPATWAIDLTPSSSTVYLAEPFTLTAGLTNLSGQTQTNVTVQVTADRPPDLAYLSATGDGWTCEFRDYPQVLCTRPSLAPGSAPPITVLLRPSALGNYHFATAVFGNSQQANASTDVQVLPSADLALTLDGPSSGMADSPIVHTVQVSNAGPGAASSLVVTLSGSTIVTAQGEDWDCTIHSCTLSSLAAGTSAAPINIVSYSETTFVVGASVSSGTHDSLLSNNTDSKAVTVSTMPGVTLTGLDPDQGPVSGGTVVTLHGDGFAPGAVVLFGTVPVDATYVSPTTITAKTPAHAPGTIDVTVVNPGGAYSTLSSAFTFSASQRRRAARH